MDSNVPNQSRIRYIERLWPSNKPLIAFSEVSGGSRLRAFLSIQRAIHCLTLFRLDLSPGLCPLKNTFRHNSHKLLSITHRVFWDHFLSVVSAVQSLESRHLWASSFAYFAFETIEMTTDLFASLTSIAQQWHSSCQMSQLSDRRPHSAERTQQDDTWLLSINDIAIDWRSLCQWSVFADTDCVTDNENWWQRKKYFLVHRQPIRRQSTASWVHSKSNSYSNTFDSE